MPVQAIKSSAELLEIQKTGAKIVAFFWAPWHEPSKLGGQLHEVVSALSQKFSSIHFMTIEAEAVPELSEKFDVSVVPTFVTLIGSEIVDKLEGANPPEINATVKKLSTATASSDAAGTSTAAVAKSPEEIKKELHARLEQLLRTAPVMLFMKGSPSQPRCGFSRKIVDILQNAEIPFASFDILTDEDVRQGLKEYSEWPTYPQLYVRGNLIGGLDIVQELVDAGNLKEQLGVTDLQMPPPPPTLQERLTALVNQDTVMLFMKGSPSEPRCGFSRKTVDILQHQGIPFSSFDILSDEDVRQGLKEFSDWPTYPQLYVKGSLIGGLDILQELVDSGDLKGQLGLV
jgi:Grx4 family monothiol glutaredoxin